MSTDGQIKIDVAKELAHLFFKMEELDNAYDVLKDTFDQYPDLVTFYGKNIWQ